MIILCDYFSQIKIINLSFRKRNKFKRMFKIFLAFQNFNELLNLSIQKGITVMSYF